MCNIWFVLHKYNTRSKNCYTIDTSSSESIVSMVISLVIFTVGILIVNHIHQPIPKEYLNSKLYKYF